MPISKSCVWSVSHWAPGCVLGMLMMQAGGLTACSSSPPGPAVGGSSSGGEGATESSSGPTADSSSDGSSSDGPAEPEACWGGLLWLDIGSTEVIPETTCVPAAPEHSEHDGLPATDIWLDCEDPQANRTVEVIGYQVDLGLEPVQLQGFNITYDTLPNRYFYMISRNGRVLALESNDLEWTHYVDVQVTGGDESCIDDGEPAEEITPVVIEGIGPDGQPVRSELGAPVLIVHQGRELLAHSSMSRGDASDATMTFIATEALVTE